MATAYVCGYSYVIQQFYQINIEFIKSYNLQASNAVYVQCDAFRGLLYDKVAAQSNEYDCCISAIL